MKSLALLFGLLLTFFPAYTVGASKVLSVWIFNLYQIEVTRNIVDEYFSYLTDETGYEYRLIISTNFSKLLSDCKNNTPDIIIASTAITELVIEGCNYTHIAKTFQNVHLSTKKEGGINSPGLVSKIGLIKGAEAAKIASSELISINNDLKSIVYPNMFSLIKNHKEDQLDSIAIPQPFIQAAPFFSKKWKSIYTFKNKGAVTVTVSSELGPVNTNFKTAPAAIFSPDKAH